MLLEKINDDFKEAMKALDAAKVSCLRLLMSVFKNVKIANQKELSQEEVLSILQKQKKQRQDSMEAYKNGSRDDLVAVEEKELAIIKAYLPEEMSEDAIKEIILNAIKDVGATGLSDTGKVMSAVMGELKGKADGKIVSKIVSESLGSMG